MNDNGLKEIVTLGGGCFWCIEAIFQELNGVEEAISGYSGGSVENPSYEQVCSGATGHAEVVQVAFNPKKITFKKILEVFFSTHNPTTLNRQGNDVGTQYRSVIFYHTPEQRRIAKEMIDELNSSGSLEGSIVTELSAFSVFYKAEDYHQEYFKINASQPYCKVIIQPKVEKLRENYVDNLKNVKLKL
ncbi:MAG: peptide-methionine (S)-S-oxide reductase MsrA [Candidatus Heimdallarchaeota archaeon]|nr:peptide-methionine (S)-S-oxide reductase MsrA [Candidatus Heimdallarchaeota archaeon]